MVEPTTPFSSPTEVFVGYLDHFRSVVAEKVGGLPEDARRTSRLPSGWTPLELLNHLTHVEHRWLEWGFEGHEVADPWADRRDGRWHVPAGVTLADLVRLQSEQAARSNRIIRAHALTDVGQPGERWDGAPPATLERVLLHLLQEYARHAGHLDVVRELTDAEQRTGRRR